MNKNEIKPIIIDCGSYMCKAGFVPDDKPTVVFPTLFGNLKNSDLDVETKLQEQKIFYIGDETKKNSAMLNISSPIEKGCIVDWERMELIWSYIFEKGLKTNPQDQPIILTESPLNPKKSREKTCEIMFETFNTPALYMSNTSVLSLITAGRDTGLAIDCGYDCTLIVPIYGGHIIRKERVFKKIDVGGRDLTDYLIKLLNKRGNNFTTSFADRQIVRDIKERLGYVALDFRKEMISAKKSTTIEKNYELQDQRVVTLGNERFRCLEPLFQPSLIGCKQEGIAQGIVSSIQKGDVDLRKDFYQGIVLFGGPSLSDGFSDRLEKGIEHESNLAFKKRVNAAPDRKNKAFIGGSILGSLSSFPLMLISGEEYEEDGPSIVNRKCY
ncbi:actin-10-related [Anaeramoeba flamelloides]|uniref:Actin-10-related n=1 Tax=Anaeramoeba flamelloides TaxID=1746091 RepID=A0ABQ8YPM0_9EUKA|nr:actin-10-related [Anaeramoeba flamelloides]